MIATMATNARPKGYNQPSREYGKPAQPLFMTERMAEKGVKDAELGRRLGESRHTINKWRHEQTRLDPFKQARVAAALGIWPYQLWVKPGSQADRILQAAFPAPDPWNPPANIPKAPKPPRRK